MERTFTNAKGETVKPILGMLVPETLAEVLDPAISAVIAVDIQNDAMRPDGASAGAGNDISLMQEALPRCAAFLAQARELGIPIVYVTQIDLPGGASSSPAWIRMMGRTTSLTSFCVKGTWGAEICSECSPAPGEVVIEKHRSSAFIGTSLDQHLRSKEIKTVVVIGQQTPGCVEATFRDAAYLDYFTVLVEDCVAAYRRDLHEASLLIQRARHDVCTAEEVLEIWRDYRTQNRSGS